MCSYFVLPAKRPDAVAQVDRATALQACDESAVRPAMGHQIKLDGYHMAARIEDDCVKLLTRSGLD
jgi:ATP-dependent DNA ligase